MRKYKMTVDGTTRSIGPESRGTTLQFSASAGDVVSIKMQVPDALDSEDLRPHDEVTITIEFPPDFP